MSSGGQAETGDASRPSDCRFPVARFGLTASRWPRTTYCRQRTSTPSFISRCGYTPCRAVALAVLPASFVVISVVRLGPGACLPPHVNYRRHRRSPAASLLQRSAIVAIRCDGNGCRDVIARRIRTPALLRCQRGLPVTRSGLGDEHLGLTSVFANL
jgi:hypothetical protein